MDFVEDSIGIYKPLMDFFHTRAYKQSVKACWNAISYNTQIGLLAEFLKLQQKTLIPVEVTVEAMSDLLVEETNSSLRIKLWEFDVEDCFKAESKLVFEVNTSMKMRDIEFEAKRLLASPEMIPIELKHTRILRKAKQLAETLKQQQATSATLLSPRDLVIKVLPKVLQIFWIPPPSPAFAMPSRYLSKMAVGVTQAVLDSVCQTLSSIQIQFSNAIRDNLVLAIHEKVRKTFSVDVLVESIHSFQPEFLKTIRNVAVDEIGALSALFVFLPPSPSPDLTSASETASLPDDGDSIDKPINKDDATDSEEATDLSSALLVSSSRDSVDLKTNKRCIFRIISKWMKIFS
ncbi:uncharacterized protein LOC144199616 [Stigmatopora nigra]